MVKAKNRTLFGSQPKHFRSNKNRNQFLYSPFCIILLGIMTFAAFAYSKELLFYGFVTAYALYVIAFCHDLSPIMPLFLFCYVTPSLSNNPGMSEDGVFYGTSRIIILCYAAIVIIALLIRITFDQSIGWAKLFKMRRSLLGGMLALGAAYLISGIGSQYFFQDLSRNTVFALIQFLSIFFLYFVFSATVDWKKFNFDYFAWSGLVAGFVVLAELAWLYVTQEIWIDGAIFRYALYTGWGTYNNMGAIIVAAIPFAFYLAQKKKHNSIYLILAALLMVGVVFSCSRSCMGFAFLTTLLSCIYALVKTENKKEFAITSILMAVPFVIAAIMLWDRAADIFQHIPSIMDSVDGQTVYGDSGRLEMYKEGIKRFLQKPIAGQGFFSRDYAFPEFSTVESFSNFFPPRLHNTIIQILSTCGIIGILAYAYHRTQTVCLLVKKRSIENVYIGIYLLGLLGMSLLDCHFFNVGPTLFYSIALAVAEFAQSKKERAKKGLFALFSSRN